MNLFENRVKSNEINDDDFSEKEFQVELLRIYKRKTIYFLYKIEFKRMNPMSISLIMNQMPV